MFHSAATHSLTRRRFLYVNGLMLATLALSACGQSAPASSPKPSGSAAAASAAPAGSAASQASGAKFTAATVSTSWTVRAMPLVAAAKGYWKEAGLQVATPIVSPGNAHMAALIGGSVDFSLNINTDLIARANAQGEKLYLVGGSSNKIDYVLFGAPQVKSWDDLKGKTVAIEGPASSTEYLVRDLAAKHNLNPGKDFQFVTIAGTVQEREQAVIGGAASAALGTGSDWPTLKSKGLNRLGELAEVYPNFQQAGVVARGAALDKEPQGSVAMMAGIIRAYRFLLDPKNDAEIASILKQGDAAVDEEHWSELLSLQRPLWPADGGLNLEGVQAAVKREQEAKRIPAEYDWHQTVRDEALKAAQKQLGIA